VVHAAWVVEGTRVPMTPKKKMMSDSTMAAKNHDRKTRTFSPRPAADTPSGQTVSVQRMRYSCKRYAARRLTRAAVLVEHGVLECGGVPDVPVVDAHQQQREGSVQQVVRLVAVLDEPLLAAEAVVVGEPELQSETRQALTTRVLWVPLARTCAQKRRVCVATHLRAHEDEVLVEGVQHESRHAAVVPPAMDQQQALQEPEAADGIVGRVGGLHALRAGDAHAHVRGADHVDVVGAVACSRPDKKKTAGEMAGHAG